MEMLGEWLESTPTAFGQAMMNAIRTTGLTLLKPRQRTYCLHIMTSMSIPAPMMVLFFFFKFSMNKYYDVLNAYLSN